MAVASVHRVDARFDGGRRRGEHDRRILETRAHDRHIARVIGNTVFLFVGCFMFFIDND